MGPVTDKNHREVIEHRMPSEQLYEMLPLLLELAKRGCLSFPRRISRTEVMKSLGYSAWRFRKLLERAESEGYIERVFFGRYVAYRVTPRGVDLLKRIHADLSAVFSSNSSIVLRGVVVPGLGEGAVYMSIPRYVEAFREALGFEPYPGTLNIRLDEESTGKRLILRESSKGIKIPGFQLDGREFCSVRVYRATIVGNSISVYGGALDIEKTKHGPEILELIAPVRLRDELRLRDGDAVEVEIMV